jgi:predicted PurR-regulated permease PerM
MAESPKNTIEITTGTIVRGIFLLFLTYLLFVLKDIVLVILTAVVIASCIEPFARWFLKRGVPRAISVIVVYALLAGIFVGTFYAFVPTLLRDTSEFLSSAPQYLDTISLWNPLGENQVERSKTIATNVAENIQTSQAAVTNENGKISIQGIVTGLNEAIQGASAGFVHSASSVFGGALSLILIVVLSFYLAVQEDGVEKFLRIVVPRQNEDYVLNLWQRTRMKIGLWMQGQLVLAVVVGILVYLGLMVLGVRNALLFAVLAAFLETIPLFGPIIAAIPAVAAAYVDNGASAGFIVAGLYLIIQQFENHLIYPLVVKKIVGVPPILVIISLLIGFKLAGFLGILLSVPLSSMLVEFLDDVQKRKVGHA